MIGRPATNISTEWGHQLRLVPLYPEGNATSVSASTAATKYRWGSGFVPLQEGASVFNKPHGGLWSAPFEPGNPNAHWYGDYLQKMAAHSGRSPTHVMVQHIIPKPNINVLHIRTQEDVDNLVEKYGSSKLGKYYPNIPIQIRQQFRWLPRQTPIHWPTVAQDYDAIRLHDASLAPGLPGGRIGRTLEDMDKDTALGPWEGPSTVFLNRDVFKIKELGKFKFDAKLGSSLNAKLNPRIEVSSLRRLGAMGGAVAGIGVVGAGVYHHYHKSSARHGAQTQTRSGRGGIAYLG